MRWDERFWKWQKLTTLNSKKLQEINVSDFNSVIVSAKTTGTNSLGNSFVIQPGPMVTHSEPQPKKARISAEPSQKDLFFGIFRVWGVFPKCLMTSKEACTSVASEVTPDIAACADECSWRCRSFAGPFQVDDAQEP